MHELGKKDEFSNVDRALLPLTIHGRPRAFPSLSRGEVVICGYDQFLWEKLYWCQTLEDMQQLFDAADGGGGFVHWYKSTALFIELATLVVSQAVGIEPEPEVDVKEADVAPYHVAVRYKRDPSRLHIFITTAHQTEEVLEWEVDTPTAIAALPDPRLIGVGLADPDGVMREIVRLAHEIDQEEVGQGNPPVLKQ